MINLYVILKIYFSIIDIIVIVLGISMVLDGHLAYERTSNEQTKRLGGQISVKLLWTRIIGFTAPIDAVMSRSELIECTFKFLFEVYYIAFWLSEFLLSILCENWGNNIKSKHNWNECGNNWHWMPPVKYANLCMSADELIICWCIFYMFVMCAQQ